MPPSAFRQRLDASPRILGTVAAPWPARRSGYRTPFVSPERAAALCPRLNEAGRGTKVNVQPTRPAIDRVAVASAWKEASLTSWRSLLGE
jgi:hypothetical protein